MIDLLLELLWLKNAVILRISDIKLRSSGNGSFNFRSVEWIFRSSTISSRESFLISLHSWVAKPVSWHATKKAAIARCLKTKQRTKCHQRILCFQKGKQANPLRLNSTLSLFLHLSCFCGSISAKKKTGISADHCVRDTKLPRAR